MKTIEDFITKQITKSRLIQLLTLIAEIRYIDFKTLKSVKKPFIEKVATKPLLNDLSENGYLNLTEQGAYTITSNSLEYIEEQGVNTRHLKSRLRGSFDTHQRKLTAYLLPVIFEKKYYATFYPTFYRPPTYQEAFLIPDASIIYRNEEAYKLIFLEIENSEKPEGYLDEKQRKYQIIAQDFNTWDKWWRKFAPILDLPFCDVNNFCFSVEVIK